MNTLAVPPRKPWYREPWPWFLLSLPAAAVIAGVATVWIATTHQDGLVVGDYYKAGLAINQTLARDEAARALHLAVTLQTRDGALILTLAGKEQKWPKQLQLTLAHPTRPGMDQMLTLDHAGGGQYHAPRPALAAGKWHAQITDGASRWRLAGVLIAPFDEAVTLTASYPHPPTQGE